MNISTVAENLRRTISGKQAMLNRLKDDGKEGYTIIKQWLEINIDELQKILADVEQCVEKDAEQSWRDNPDRMGGQFTDEEIQRAGEWR
jgi:hypothetical protein